MDSKKRIKEMHEKMLYTVARVTYGTGGGSGTLIYSGEDPKSPGEYINLVLTNQHVVDKAIEVKKEWDSLVKRKVDKEFLNPMHVELFSYVYVSRRDKQEGFRANIIAYDKLEDMAIVRVDSPRKLDYVAKLIPQEEIGNIKLFQHCYAVGCTYLHDPFCADGYITYMPEIIDNKEYWMGSANISFGNSGGAVFTGDTLQLIGIPSRVTVSGFEVANWMGYFIPPQRIYKFLEEQELRFICDPEDNWYDAMERRERKKKQALAELAVELQRE